MNYEDMTLEELEAENQRLMQARADIKAQMMLLKPFYDAAAAAEERRRILAAMEKAKIDPALWQGVGMEADNG